MSNESSALERVYSESSEFIILGLTGRTGSGCSTAAKILANDQIHIPEESNIYSSDNDKRKYKIVRSYIKENWAPFISIQMRVVITGILLELNFDELGGLISDVLEKKPLAVGNALSSFRDKYVEAHKEIVAYKALPETNSSEKNTKKDKAWCIYFDYLPDFCADLKKTLQTIFGADSYTALYQQVGDNIRASGKANSIEFDAEKIFTLPKIVNKLIKVIRRKNNNRAFVTIDAIRNPFEAYFFHQRYSGFYLLSINTPNEERLNHLRESHKFSEDSDKGLGQQGVSRETYW